VVCNDTGMSHVAAAVDAPSVVISSGADARRWRPLDEERHRMLWHDVHCRPCAHRFCPTAHECALGVGVGAVMAEAQRLLERETARAA
jgi:ADP-heptose:LPS heptosyltransferase